MRVEVLPGHKEATMGKTARAALLSLAAASLVSLLIEYLLNDLSTKSSLSS